MTTETRTLADFLLARIAEDESVANAASTWQVRDEGGWKDIPAEPAEWFAGDHGYGVGAVERRNAAPHDVGIVVYDEGCPSEAESEHIARHDPARVLAECEAKRQIVEMHKPLMDTECDVCADDSPSWDRGCLKWPCPTLRAIGAVYAGHSDYREEWKP